VTLWECRNRGYNDIPEGANKIIPGGYGNGHPEIYHYVPYLRRLASRKKTGYDVYGRFGLEFAREIRRKAVELLRGQNHFVTVGASRRSAIANRWLKQHRRRFASTCPVTVISASGWWIILPSALVSSARAIER